MNRSFLFKILILCISLKVIAANFECELRNRLSRGIRDLPLIPEKGLRPPMSDAMQRLRKKIARKRLEKNAELTGSGLHALTKHLEVILSSLIPNHNLVQDLLGYVTLPKPMRDYPIHVAMPKPVMEYPVHYGIH